MRTSYLPETHLWDYRVVVVSIKYESDHKLQILNPPVYDIIVSVLSRHGFRGESAEYEQLRLDTAGKKERPTMCSI